MSSIDEANEDTNKKNPSDENKVVDIKKLESSGETNQNGSNVKRDNANKQNDTWIYAKMLESFAQRTKDLYLDIYYVSDKLAYSLYIAYFYYTDNIVTYYSFVYSGYFFRRLSMTHEDL